MDLKEINTAEDLEARVEELKRLAAIPELNDNISLAKISEAEKSFLNAQRICTSSQSYGDTEYISRAAPYSERGLSALNEAAEWLQCRLKDYTTSLSCRLERFEEKLLKQSKKVFKVPSESDTTVNQEAPNRYDIENSHISQVSLDGYLTFLEGYRTNITEAKKLLAQLQDTILDSQTLASVIKLHAGQEPNGLPEGKNNPRWLSRYLGLTDQGHRLAVNTFGRFDVMEELYNWMVCRVEAQVPIPNPAP